MGESVKDEVIIFQKKLLAGLQSFRLCPGSYSLIVFNHDVQRCSSNWSISVGDSKTSRFSSSQDLTLYAGVKFQVDSLECASVSEFRLDRKMPDHSRSSACATNSQQLPSPSPKAVVHSHFQISQTEQVLHVLTKIKQVRRTAGADSGCTVFGETL